MNEQKSNNPFGSEMLKQSNNSNDFDCADDIADEGGAQTSIGALAIDGVKNKNPYTFAQ